MNWLLCSLVGFLRKNVLLVFDLQHDGFSFLWLVILAQWGDNNMMNDEYVYRSAGKTIEQAGLVCC